MEKIEQYPSADLWNPLSSAVATGGSGSGRKRKWKWQWKWAGATSIAGHKMALRTYFSAA